MKGALQAGELTEKQGYFASVSSCMLFQKKSGIVEVSKRYIFNEDLVDLVMED